MNNTLTNCLQKYVIDFKNLNFKGKKLKFVKKKSYKPCYMPSLMHLDIKKRGCAKRRSLH